MESRNVTITLDEDTARWVRVEAARQDTSVSKYVGALLRGRMVEDQGYASAMESYLRRPGRSLRRRGTYANREELHDRAGLR